MPRPGPRRPYVGVRLDSEALARIDAEAERRGLKRSEAMRLMLDYALAKMPDKWKATR